MQKEYKKGDRFIIEIDNVTCINRNNKCGNIYTVKGFNTLVFDDYGLYQLKQIPDDAEVVTLDHIMTTNYLDDEKYSSEINICSYDTPWEIACELINAGVWGKKYFELDDLQRIAEHLMNYVRIEREKENDTE